MTDRVQYLYVDSKNRSEPYGNAYTVHLPDIIRGVYRVDLVSARIPNSMYNLTNGSNDIAYNGTTLSLPPGFYSAPTLATYIGYASGSAVSVNYLPSEGKFIFYQASPFTINALSTQMSNLIGLPQNTTISSSISSLYTGHPVYGGKEIIKSSNVVDLSVNEYIFLDIEELRTQYTLDTKPITGNTFPGSTIAHSFAMIPMDISSGGIKCFKEHTDYVMSIWYPKAVDSLSRLTIRWLDKDNNIVSFNGVETNSFTLRVYSNM
jgi:hypothetical protein